MKFSSVLTVVIVGGAVVYQSGALFRDREPAAIAPDGFVRLDDEAAATAEPSSPSVAEAQPPAQFVPPAEVQPILPQPAAIVPPPVAAQQLVQPAQYYVVGTPGTGGVVPVSHVAPVVVAGAVVGEDGDSPRRPAPPRLSSLRYLSGGSTPMEIPQTAQINPVQTEALRVSVDFPGVEPAAAKDQDTLVFFVDGIEVYKEADITGTAGPKDYDIPKAAIQSLAEQSTHLLTAAVRAKDSDVLSASSNRLRFAFDTQPPRLSRVDLVGTPGQAGLIVVRFEDDDLDPASLDASIDQKILLQRQDGQQWVGAMSLTDPSFDGATISFPVPVLNASNYRVVVAGVAPSPLIKRDNTQIQTATPITDLAGNKFATTAAKVFTSFPGPLPAEHIEFPQFLPPNVTDPEKAFNPGAHVETRVVRLYYYRDAPRVAQLINRNLKSYNEAAVTQAQRTAETLRDSADSAVDERRQNERAAVRAAEDTRLAESRLRQAEQALEQARATMAAMPAEIAAIDARLAELKGDAENDGLIKRAEEERDDLIDQRKSLFDKRDSLESSDSTDPPSKAVLQGQLSVAEGELALERTILSQKTVQLNQIPSDSQKPQDIETRATLTREITVHNANIQTKLREIELIKVQIATVTRQIDELTRQIEQFDRDIAAASETLSELRREEQTLQSRRSLLLGDATVASGAPLTDTTAVKEGVDEAARRVEEYRQQVADARAREREAGEQALQSQAREDRAKERQFRAEVDAATADPNNYAPAIVESRDPVSQVSISVIGEGLIQLRGPIDGINEIRTMINQIDAPIGQVKVGIHTIQINGEHGDRMNGVAARIEGHLDTSRFLVSQSLMYLRRAIQEVAGAYAAAVDAQYPGHTQRDRDMKYLYAFFGRDFVDELYAMDSEFLHTENKLLSIHSMDTISLSKALFIISLAKNDVRQEVLARFMDLIRCELPRAEYDFRMANPRQYQGWKAPDEPEFQDVAQRAYTQYTFRSLRGYFDAQVGATDVMTPTQREFIRLAQIFKSQLVAEMELKQRVVERGLVQDRVGEDQRRLEILKNSREIAFTQEEESLKQVVEAATEASQAQHVLQGVLVQISSMRTAANDATREVEPYLPVYINILKEGIDNWLKSQGIDRERKVPVEFQGMQVTPVFEDDEFRTIRIEGIEKVVVPLDRLENSLAVLETTFSRNSHYGDDPLYERVREVRDILEGERGFGPLFVGRLEDTLADVNDFLSDVSIAATELANRMEAIARMPTETSADWHQRLLAARALDQRVREVIDVTAAPQVGVASRNLLTSTQTALSGTRQLEQVQALVDRTRSPLDYKKLLDFLIDEQREKYIDLREATRSHIAAVDGHIKRLYIALEDDFKVQFYDPAFADIREAAWEWDVQMGQVERTTILTNNRQFAKVTPEATMEFDLPKRDTMIVEAMGGARALVQEYGTLLQDPTFLSLTGMLSGAPAVGGTAAGSAISGLPGGGLASPGVQTVLPGLPSDNMEQLMAASGGPDRTFGASLEALIPDPAVYKFETGTGFEIRPVIQPDGDSIVYDFNYMYSTNIREPVRPDEKHLGRVRRHYIHTQVQTSTFELREVSRYLVALKASRTSRGVPLLEDIPGLGVLFRPLPSDSSSLQQNIILAESTVYPTLFDLMGLRWAPSAVDLDHVGLRDAEHVVRGRDQIVSDFVFDYGGRQVDGFLGIGDTDHSLRRPDLYRRQSIPSPYHPGGYVQDDPLPEDPTRRRFEIDDPRPYEMQEPVYDRLHRDERLPFEATPGFAAPGFPAPAPGAIEVAPGQEGDPVPSGGPEFNRPQSFRFDPYNSGGSDELQPLAQPVTDSRFHLMGFRQLSGAGDTQQETTQADYGSDSEAGLPSRLRQLFKWPFGRREDRE